MSKPAAIFFDWDGTLVDTFDLLEQSHNYALSSFGLPVFEKGGFMPYFGGPREKIYQSLYGEDLAAEAQRRFEEFFTAHHCELVNVMPGATEFLEFALDSGIPCGVVSNKKPEFVKREIEHLGWTARFVSVVGGGEAANDKPAADPLYLGIVRSGLNVSTSDIWYIGDSEADLSCAQIAGSRCVFVDPEGEKTSTLSKYTPYLIVRDCGGIIEHLSKLL